MKERLEQCAQILDQVIQGSCSVERALRDWPIPYDKTCPIADDAKHLLYHFEADTDLLDSDPDYKASMLGKLREHLARIGARLEAS
jgi:hypothetical protein